MGYHIRLSKGLSYYGFEGRVTATRSKPDVILEDKATADAAVASGYFSLVEGEDTGEPITGHLDRAMLEGMSLKDLKALATDMGLDCKGFKEKQDYVDAIAAQEVVAGPETSEGDEGGNVPDYGEEQ